jgi:hypothetical protein
MYIDAYNGSVSLGMADIGEQKPGFPALILGCLAPYIRLGSSSTVSMEIMGKKAVWVEDESGYFTLRGI